MAKNPNQPGKYDAVLGGQNQSPKSSAILGGLEGVKIRLASVIAEQRAAALSETIKYGEAGLDLVIQALNDESKQVQRTAFWLLHNKRTEPKVKQILQEYIPIKSAVSVDYTRLKELLTEWKWEEADRETATIMLKAACREQEGWLPVADVKIFPYEDINTIDNLWAEYSDGRFGFSVQKQIWQSVKGKQNIFDWEAWGQFGHRVGWRRYGFWIDYNELTFALNAPEGHLPGWVGWGDGRMDAKFLMFGGGFILSFKGWASILHSHWHN